MRILIRKLIKAGLPVCVFPSDSPEAILEARDVYASAIAQLKNGETTYVCHALYRESAKHTGHLVCIFEKRFILGGQVASGTVFEWLERSTECARILRSAPYGAAYLVAHWNLPVVKKYGRAFRIAWIEEMRRMFNEKVRKERKANANSEDR